jgi:hypothetical protein
MRQYKPVFKNFVACGLAKKGLLSCPTRRTFRVRISSAINGELMLLPAPSDSISYDDSNLALRRRPNSRRNPCFNDAIHDLTSNNNRKRALSEPFLENALGITRIPRNKATAVRNRQVHSPSVVPAANSASQKTFSSRFDVHFSVHNLGRVPRSCFFVAGGKQPQHISVRGSSPDAPPVATGTKSVAEHAFLVTARQKSTHA